MAKKTKELEVDDIKLKLVVDVPDDDKATVEEVLTDVDGYTIVKIRQKSGLWSFAAVRQD